MLYEPTEEQRRGDAPTCAGGEWILEDGMKVTAQVYNCYFGGGEAIDTDGDGKVDTAVKAEFNLQGFIFFLWGLYMPVLKVIDACGPGFDSAEDAPRLFEAYFKKIKHFDCLQSEFGKLFLRRIPDCLNYSWPEP